MAEKPIIAALGAGRMGRGLAHVFAYAGHDIRLLDVKQRSAEEFAALEAAALTDIRRTIGLMAALGRIEQNDIDDILARVSVLPLDRTADAIGDAALILEGVREVLDAKKRAFAIACEHAGPDAVIASTTSTMLVDELAAFVDRPERFLNAHWLNPAFLIPLVELSVGTQTSPDIVGRLKSLLETVGKVPVVLKAKPGFVVPRIQSLAMSEAARAVEDGIASAEEIDKATRVGFGLRFAILGLIEFIDWGGNDILYYAGNYMKDAFGSDRFEVPAIAEQYMKEGRNGLREGRGFYDYRDIDVDAYQLETLRKLIDLIDHLGLMAPPGGVTDPADSPAAKAGNPFLKS
ncbi:MAG: 3-hydroxybutyryl-CoA dehydrogenase [Alphaproteobacteria bacterium]